jgi:tRNA(adenine34) deaminase
MKNHEHWMQIALEEAQKAFSLDEVPVGAVLVKDDELVLKAHNMTNSMNTPLAHAEMIILQKIQKTEKVLSGYTLYVTLEPCLMCSGAIILCKLSCLVYGTADPKTGVAGSLYNVLNDKRLNHQPKVISGILHEECCVILKKFFKNKRQEAYIR